MGKRPQRKARIAHEIVEPPPAPRIPSLLAQRDTGNDLLNIGPRGDGSVPAESVKSMRAIGAWMRVNGQSVYGTTAGPFEKLAWGRATKKATRDGATIYLHVFDWPADGKLFVPGLKNQVESAALLADGKRLTAVAGADGVVVRIPAAPPDRVSSTVVLKVKGALKVG